MGGWGWGGGGGGVGGWGGVGGGGLLGRGYHERAKPHTNILMPTGGV